MSQHVIERQDGGGRVTQLTVLVSDHAWAGGYDLVTILDRTVVEPQTGTDNAGGRA